MVYISLLRGSLNFINDRGDNLFVLIARVLG